MTTKILDALFLLIAALLPVQLNKFFFVDASYILGVPIDYRAPSLYLSDIAIIAFVIFYFLRMRPSAFQIHKDNKILFITLIAFNLYVITNNFFHGSLPITTHFSLKVLMFSLFFVAATKVLLKAQIKKKLYFVFCFSLIWQSILIILQFLTQHSQGLWFLGERSFDQSTVNIAHISLSGTQLLRAYGTFPHPNVAAAFLVLGLIVTGFLSPTKNKTQSKFKLIVTLLTAVALILTFSRAAIIVFAIYLVLNSKNTKSLIIKLIGLLAIASLLFTSVINSQLASIAERLTLTSVSLDVVSSNLLFGVGNTNFLTHLAALDLTSLAQTRLIQPVHNIFLLILAENGILGFLLFCAFLFIVSQRVKDKISFLLYLAILIFGTFDHFLWTLHQGQILLWLVLAIVVADPGRRKPS